jgi:hypothetical protein
MVASAPELVQQIALHRLQAILHTPWVVSVWQLPGHSAASAVDVLLEVFPDFPGSNTLDSAGHRRPARPNLP